VTSPDAGFQAGSPFDKEDAKKKVGPGRALRETVLLLTVAILLALVVKTFFVQSFYIPSESMEPGLVVNDRILVQKPSYWNGEPQRGDVIVFDDPGDWLSGLQNPQPQNLLARGLSKIGLYPTGGHLVKRVIGVEGDVVSCCDEQGRLMVNGEPMNEPYVFENNPIDQRAFGPITVPAGRLFMMGDHRGFSQDSRAYIGDPFKGTIPIDQVIGRAFVKVWPVARWGGLEVPANFDVVPVAQGARQPAGGGGERAGPGATALVHAPLVVGLLVPLRWRLRRRWRAAARWRGVGGRGLRRARAAVRRTSGGGGSPRGRTLQP
jgi:signal peptidase I